MRGQQRQADRLARCLIEQFTHGADIAERLRHLGSGIGEHSIVHPIPGELFARFTPEPKFEPGEDVARQAFALVEQLDSDIASKPPTPMSVFRLYCMEGLSAA